jgi:hypothetical protein
VVDKDGPSPIVRVKVEEGSEEEVLVLEDGPLSNAGVMVEEEAKYPSAKNQTILQAL